MGEIDMSDARLKIEPVPALSFKTLHPTVRMFLESMYGQENLLLWNYTGSCVVPCVKHPNDTDIIVLVKSRAWQLLFQLPEWVEVQTDYDHDYITRYTLSWFDEANDKQQMWDVLVMDELDKYTDWIVATQLLIALDLPHKAKHEVLYQAVLNMYGNKHMAICDIHSRLHTRTIELAKLTGDNNG